MEPYCNKEVQLRGELFIDWKKEAISQITRTPAAHRRSL